MLPWREAGPPNRHDDTTQVYRSPSAFAWVDLARQPGVKAALAGAGAHKVRISLPPTLSLSLSLSFSISLYLSQAGVKAALPSCCDQNGQMTYVYWSNDVTG